MKRALVPTTLVVLAVGLAMNAGFPTSDCCTGMAYAASADPSDSPTLTVGSAAPALTVTKWVKGDEVKSFESGKVYVVEFWATWCPPCRESIPHLTDLQKSHKADLTVIGVASSERKPKTGDDNRQDKLESFVTAQGDKMAYTVAYDAKGKTGVDWMNPAGRTTIPTAFVVGADGKIAWIGNPLDDSFGKAVDKAIENAKAKKST